MALDPRKGVPLQVVTVDLKTNEVMLVPESMKILQKNLTEAGVEKLSVVSVMGAYRTGKSFLLDIFIRYLCAGENVVEKQTPREEGAFEVPSWLSEHGPFTEDTTGTTPRSENAQEAPSSKVGGFNWRGGAARVTEGMWIWSVPFIRHATIEETEVRGDEEITKRRKVKVGVLLMDTQGAFDSETTKQQSAALFGMTTAISSKQVYNLQGRLGSDVLEHLHYFAEMAVSAIRQGEHDSTDMGGHHKTKKKPFQYLEFCVRDWANFEDETFEDAEVRAKYRVPEVPEGSRWSMKHCQAQCQIHKDQHMGEEIKERNTVDMLEQMFEEIQVYLLPNPGMKVAESRKRKWDGNLNDIDEDFLRFVESYCHKLFGTTNVQGILGQDLSPDTFPQVFEALLEAFKGLEVSKLSMVEAIGKAKNLVAKDDSSKLYKKHLLELIKKNNGLAPEEMVKEHENLVKEAMSQYTREATFGDIEAIEESRGELEKAIQEIYVELQKQNERILEQALSAFAGIASIAIIAFVLDRSTDFTCDWWSDTCVALSKMFLVTYSAILAIIAFQVWRLTRERGKTAAGLAAIELGKGCLKVMSNSIENAKYYSTHRDEFKTEVQALANRVMTLMQNDSVKNTETAKKAKKDD